MKALPFKTNFFLWRDWKRRIAIDDNLRRMRINIASRWLDIEDKILMQTIKCWWYAEAPNNLKIVMRPIPALIM
ncbi:hypothetical protein H5410_003232 [Solanum commersonii]|uniref:Uncharacterized protein n=1 Tax=Solanum commersonii TaxID=4109 RepID=A0A9J6B4H0_SOLCO|nr:hypothetical protein H5410_003232 [Solanum commersonii]